MLLCGLWVQLVARARSSICLQCRQCAVLYCATTSGKQCTQQGVRWCCHVSRRRLFCYVRICAPTAAHAFASGVLYYQPPFCSQSFSSLVALRELNQQQQRRCKHKQHAYVVGCVCLCRWLYLAATAHAFCSRCSVGVLGCSTAASELSVCGVCDSITPGLCARLGVSGDMCVWVCGSCACILPHVVCAQARVSPAFKGCLVCCMCLLFVPTYLDAMS